MDELSPEARVALDALREDLPDDLARTRMRQRILAAGAAATAGTLMAGSAQAATVSGHVSGAAAASTGALGGSLASLSASKLVLVIASLGAVSAGAGVLHQTGAFRSPARERVLVSAPASAASSASTLVEGGDSAREQNVEHAPSVVGMPEPEPTLEGLARAVSEPTRTRGTSRSISTPQARSEATKVRTPKEEPPVSTRASESALGPSVLSAESALLLKALSAFQGGHACRALSLLDEHEREFGGSAGLAPERERMRVRFMKTESELDLTRCDAPKGTLP